MEISIQSGGIVNEYGAKAGYKYIADAGFTAIDWNLDDVFKEGNIFKSKVLKDLCIFERPLDEILEYYAEEITEIRKNNLTITQAHAPFPAYWPNLPNTLDYSIEIYKKVILLCDAVGCKNLVIHGISPRPEDIGMTFDRGREMNMRLYESLIETLLTTNVTVCLENLFATVAHKITEGVCSDPHQAVEYIDTLNETAGREVFGLCLDTGHITLLGKRFPYYVPIVNKRIKALHIHDNDGFFDRHLAPYTGVTNWGEFISSMKEIGYEGDLSFETFRQTKKEKIGEELLPLFLKHIHSIGEYFKKKILE